ncbi:ATP-grasp domain-containing protein [Actinocrispum sp. NPDC049592]|uniref:ATP-grasp domain-containing protein n=1 Tax=Actinocrispum sp. NPDC049592 TaxID=3154835 RepID=UPI0034186115
MPGRLIFVESNTTGSGMLALTTARRLGLDPVLLSGRPQRYAGLAETGVEVIECDTNSPEAIASRLPGRIAGVTTTSEYFLEVVAQVAHCLGLPGNPPEAVRRCRDKSATREALAREGVGQPRFVAVRHHRLLTPTLRKVGLPCVVKPVNESGSQDVVLCHSEPQVRAHLRRILSARVNARDQPVPGVALVEEYLDAAEYSVEMFSSAGTATCVGITAKSVSGDPYFVESGHHYPAALSPSPTQQLICLARDALDAVGLREGPSHIEVKLSPSRAAVVEINARLAGGMIPELVRLVDGIDLIEQQIRAVAGRPVDLTPVRREDRCAGIRFLMVDRTGRVASVSGVEQAMALPGVHRVHVSAAPGSGVARAQDAYGRIGHVIAGGPDSAEVESRLDRALDLIRIAVTDTSAESQPG